ncbi:unnamed protein product [Brassica oleracea var. botrytis]
MIEDGEDGEEATWTADLVVESKHDEELKPPQLSTTRSSNHSIGAWKAHP